MQNTIWTTRFDELSFFSIKPFLSAKRDRLWCRSPLLSSTWTKSNHPSFTMISNQVRKYFHFFCPNRNFKSIFYRKYSADRRLRERWHQNHGLWSVQNHGFWKLQSGTWHGFDVARRRNLLVLATRMLCGGQNAAQNLVKSRRLVTRCHFLPMSLRQKGTFYSFQKFVYFQHFDEFLSQFQFFLSNQKFVYFLRFDEFFPQFNFFFPKFVYFPHFDEFLP